MCIPPLSLKRAPNNLGSYHPSKTIENQIAAADNIALKIFYEINTTEQKKVIIRKAKGNKRAR